MKLHCFQYIQMPQLSILPHLQRNNNYSTNCLELPLEEALFDKVAEKLELTESEKNDRISSFYTDISLDGRLVNVKDNKWDLRVNQKYENVHMDINDVYAEMDAEAIGNRDREEYDPDEEDAQGNFSDEDSSDDIDYDTSSKRDI